MEHGFRRFYGFATGTLTATRVFFVLICENLPDSRHLRSISIDG